MLGIPEPIDAGKVALFLDVDGTLLDLREHPGDVVADSELIGMLEACAKKLDGALSLISGRSIAEIDRIFFPEVFPAAGAHGAELRTGGDRPVIPADAPFPAMAAERLESLVAKHAGLMVEMKRGGASLHYRKAPELEGECGRAVNALLADLGDSYRLIAGKMVFEIAPAAHNKGEAIRAFLDEPPFEGRLPVFVGDDVTDEDGFRAVNRAGGTSVRVGDGEPSEAQYRLPDVASVRTWLESAILRK